MRKSHEAVARAFLAGRTASAGNLTTNGEALFLFGHKVAEWEGGRPRVTFCGWVTATTTAVLNAVAECAESRMRFCRDNGEPQCRDIQTGTVWRVRADQWLTLS